MDAAVVGTTDGVKSAKKFCSEVVTLLFDRLTVNLDSVRYLIFWLCTQVFPSHSGCLNRLKSAELLDAGSSAARISQRLSVQRPLCLLCLHTWIT